MGSDKTFDGQDICLAFSHFLHQIILEPAVLFHMFFILPLGKSEPFHLQANWTVILVTTLQGDKQSQEAFTRLVAKAKTACTYLGNMCELKNMKVTAVPASHIKTDHPKERLEQDGHCKESKMELWTCKFSFNSSYQLYNLIILPLALSN